MMTARIGRDGRIHQLLRYAVPSGRALARCGQTGRALLTADGEVSCPECRQPGSACSGATGRIPGTARDPTPCACGCEVLSRGA